MRQSSLVFTPPTPSPDLNVVPVTCCLFVALNHLLPWMLVATWELTSLRWELLTSPVKAGYSKSGRFSHWDRNIKIQNNAVKGECSSGPSCHRYSSDFCTGEHQRCNLLLLLQLQHVLIDLTDWSISFTQSSDGGWYIKGSREPWTGPSPLSSSSLTGPSPLSFSSSKPSFSSSGASRIQTSTTRSILFPRTTPKYKSLSAKEFQRLKSTSSKRKTTTKNVGVQFSAPSVELTTPSTRRKKPAFLSNYRQRTSFTNTFVEAPLKHFRVSNFG